MCVRHVRSHILLHYYNLERYIQYSNTQVFVFVRICEDFSDPKSPTSNHIHLTFSVVCDTIKIFYPCVFILFNR